MTKILFAGNIYHADKMLAERDRHVNVNDKIRDNCIHLHSHAGFHYYSGGEDMSFRPTISVAAEGGIADIRFYRNWDMEDLFIESVALALIYSDLKTVEEVRERTFGRQDIRYILEPELIANTQENMMSLMECSEFPITVDLRFGGIYSGFPVETAEAFSRIPDIDVIQGYSRGDYFYWDMMSKYKITFAGLDIDYLKEMFLGDGGLTSRLSSETYRIMERTFRKRSA